MHVSRKLTRYWLIALALAMASLLIARPLHEARHLAEPLVASLTQAADGLAADGGSEADDPAGDPEQRLGGCVWCLIHAQAAHTAFVAPDLPAALDVTHVPPRPPLTLAPVPRRLPVPPSRGPPHFA
ncbi:DUF2946 family protein [Roseateles amylovorans]|uniref:DUF2946 family protein n=1 Tax=Roseateles amylovorans TaxID=2978473 RepID=A0ABY6AVR7_9BURK|nr:DUF2946 family protein [Roseateles amylovorans]UXH76957.1 DUF2946 family protein [Roseateles amylovorans]